MAENKRQIRTSCEKVETFSIEKACKSHNLIKNLCAVIKTHQDKSAKNLGMSIIHLLYSNHDKMLECLDVLAQNHPDISLIHRRIAEIYISRNNFKMAVAHLEKALKIDNEDLTAKIWLGLSYYEIGNEKKAKICLDLLKDDVFFLHASNSNWIN